jgi:CYTH domain-containing protein
MAKEIERKFLVTGEPWRSAASRATYRQGYLSSQPERSVRVRTDGTKAKLTIKGLTRGASRDEFEYDIPLADAQAMLDQLCERPLIEKTRYLVPFGGRTWEIDVFQGENLGLVVAEVELDSEDESLTLPPWAAREVTDDPRYFNTNLVKNPFKDWRT